MEDTKDSIGRMEESAQDTAVPANKRIEALIKEACNPGNSTEVQEAAKNAIEGIMFLEMDATIDGGFPGLHGTYLDRWEQMHPTMDCGSPPGGRANYSIEERRMLNSLWEKSRMPGYRAVAAMRGYCKLADVAASIEVVYPELKKGNIRPIVKRMKSQDKLITPAQRETDLIIWNLRVNGATDNELLNAASMRSDSAERGIKKQKEVLSAESERDWSEEDFEVMKRAAKHPDMPWNARLYINAKYREIVENFGKMEKTIPKPRSQDGMRKGRMGRVQGPKSATSTLTNTVRNMRGAGKK